MTTIQMLITFLGALGGGAAIASAAYAVMRRMGNWKRELETISPIPATDGKLCTSNRVELTRRVLCGMLLPFGAGVICAIWGFAQAEVVFVLAAILFQFIALFVAFVWVFLRRKYGDSIRYTDTAFTVISLRIEPRRQTHPWNHLKSITQLDEDHIRLDFKNGTTIILAYLTDTDDLIRTALNRVQG